MKLNPDCIRDIMLTVEENCTFTRFIGVSLKDMPPFPHLESYSPEETMYHVRQCELSGLLYGVKWLHASSCYIHDLTPQGHQFLSDIRSDTNWNHTKEVAQKVGSSSINTLMGIASNVIASLINAQFLNPIK